MNGRWGVPLAAWRVLGGGGCLLGSLCTAGDVPAWRRLPVPCHPRWCGARGRRVVVSFCKSLAKSRILLHSRCCPAGSLAKRGMARAGSGAVVPPLAGACITWAVPSFHDRNPVGRISLPDGNGASITGELHPMTGRPCQSDRSAGTPADTLSHRNSQLENISARGCRFNDLRTRLRAFPKSVRS